MKPSASNVLSVGALALFLAGCGSNPDKRVGELEQRLQVTEQKLAGTKETNTGLETKVGRLESDLSSAEARAKQAEMDALNKPVMEASLLPPGARAGECYARVYIPPVYRTSSETLLKHDAREEVVTDPTRFGWEEREVLAKAEAERIEIVPAVYGWDEEQILAKPASTKLVVEPAVYRAEEEQVLVRAAYTTWKKGRGPIERINESTGEIMCLVEVPAEYKTVRKQVLVTPAKTREVALPAEYKTIRKRVMVTPPQTRTIKIPAEYKTERVRVEIEPAHEHRKTIPAEYQTVTKTEMVKEGGLEWRSILCETNTTPDVVVRIQRALDAEGYNPGRIDGVIGGNTMAAVSAFQKDRGMATGQLTMATLKALDVRP